MKKRILIVLLLIGSMNVALAQSFPPDSVRRMLKHFLVEIKDSGYPESYSEFGLSVRDLLADQDLGPIVREYPYVSTPDVRAILNGNGAGIGVPQYGIYAIQGDQWPSGEHIVIKHGDEYITIKMYDWYNRWRYLDVLQELINYFATHPDANEWLMPVYNEAIFNLWKENQNIPTH